MRRRPTTQPVPGSRQREPLPGMRRRPAETTRQPLRCQDGGCLIVLARAPAAGRKIKVSLSQQVRLRAIAVVSWPSPHSGKGRLIVNVSAGLRLIPEWVVSLSQLALSQAAALSASIPGQVISLSQLVFVSPGMGCLICLIVSAGLRLIPGWVVSLSQLAFAHPRQRLSLLRSRDGLLGSVTARNTSKRCRPRLRIHQDNAQKIVDALREHGNTVHIITKTHAALQNVGLGAQTADRRVRRNVRNGHCSHKNSLS